MKNRVFKAEADRKDNVLRVQFWGVATGSRLQVESEPVAEILKQLRPGFTVLVDLTDLESMDLDCLASVTRLMDLYVAAKVGRVIRVIPDAHKDIGLNILAITHYRGRVPTKTCRTRAEAEAAIGG